MEKPTYDCEFCNLPIEEKAVISKDHLFFHSICRLYAEDNTKALDVSEELMNNVKKWQQKHPGWKYLSLYS